MYPSMNPSIEEEADIRVSSRAADLLVEMLGELPEEPSTQGRGRPRKIGFSDLSPDEQRSYKAERARARREKIRTSIADDGVVLFDADSAREALADAAILILAGNLEGADNVRRYLAGVFREQPGAPMQIEARLKSGKLKARYLTCTQPRSI